MEIEKKGKYYYYENDYYFVKVKKHIIVIGTKTGFPGFDVHWTAITDGKEIVSDHVSVKNAGKVFTRYFNDPSFWSGNQSDDQYDTQY